MLVEVELADALVDDDAGAVEDVSGTVVGVVVADGAVVVAESDVHPAATEATRVVATTRAMATAAWPSLLPPRAVENACPNSSPISKRPVPESLAQS